jgi:hypothetical protein
VFGDMIGIKLAEGEEVGDAIYLSEGEVHGDVIDHSEGEVFGDMIGMDDGDALGVATDGVELGKEISVAEGQVLLGVGNGERLGAEFGLSEVDDYLASVPLFGWPDSNKVRPRRKDFGLPNWKYNKYTRNKKYKYMIKSFVFQKHYRKCN